MTDPDASVVGRVHLSDRVRHRAVADEGVLVHLESGRVVVVSEVGLHVVRALSRRDMTVVELAEDVAREFEVEVEQVRADIVAFLEELRAERVIIDLGAGESGPAKG